MTFDKFKSDCLKFFGDRIPGRSGLSWKTPLDCCLRRRKTTLLGVIILVNLGILLVTQAWLQSTELLPSGLLPKSHLPPPVGRLQKNGDAPEYAKWKQEQLQKRVDGDCGQYACAALDRLDKQLDGFRKAPRDNRNALLAEAIKLQEEFPDVPELNELLGDWYQELGKNGDAAKYFELVLRKEPLKTSMISKIGMAYFRDGQKISAHFWMRKEVSNCNVNPQLALVPPSSRLSVALRLNDISQSVNIWDTYAEERAIIINETVLNLNSGKYLPVGSFYACMLGFSAGDVMRISISSAQSQRAYALAAPGFRALGKPLPLGPYYNVDSAYKVTINSGATVPALWSYNRLKNIVAGEKIRIGYISYDYKNHAVGVWFQGWVKEHSAQFEVYCFDAYSADRTGDSVYTAIKERCPNWISVAGDDSFAAAKKVNDASIDILVDLGLWTAGSRVDVMASKPAPIQLGFAGFAGTSGAEYYDYIVADHTTIPASLRRYYTENLIYMPWAYHPWYHKELYKVQSPHARAQFGVPDKTFMYCNFVNNYRWTPQAFDAWMSILRLVPQSALILKWASDEQERSLKQWVTDRYPDIGAARLFFLKGYGTEHIGIKAGVCDVHLDVKFYNGHSASADMLWAGVPTVANAGEDMASRVAESFLRSLGLDELCANSTSENDWREYIRIASSLGNQRQYYLRVRDYLERARVSAPLFDMPRFMKNFETALESIYNRFLHDLPLQDIHMIDYGPKWLGVRQVV